MLTGNESICGSYGSQEFPTEAEEKRLLDLRLKALPKKARRKALLGNIGDFWEALDLPKVSEEEARSWLDVVADRVQILPPYGVEYQNTGNYIPGGQRRWYFGGEFIAAEDWWLDG